MGALEQSSRIRCSIQYAFDRATVHLDVFSKYGRQYGTLNRAQPFWSTDSVVLPITQSPNWALFVIGTFKFKRVALCKPLTW
jgi:hypothetical protein